MPTLTLKKTVLQAKGITIASSIIAAVILPQIIHAIGAVFGQGPAVGMTFLPMHIPVFIAGFLAGPVVGVLAGILSPFVSFAISGMPAESMLPFMTIELAGYGLAAGLLMRVKMPIFGKLLIIQIAGRLLRAGAILIAVSLLSGI